MARVLVTGGCGYIGSHTIVDLIENGHEVVSIDNHLRSTAAILENIQAVTGVVVRNHAVDLCDYAATRKALEDEGRIDSVIHYAALKSVPESVRNPVLYYHNNINALITILHCVEHFDIPQLIFSSSCTVYGEPDQLPVTEASPLKQPVSPYGATKQIGEELVADFARYHRFNAVMLRYFNPVGAHPSGKLGQVPGEQPENLLPLVSETAIGKRAGLTVHGNDYTTRDGTCIRDYIHVMDIAHAHVLAMQHKGLPGQPAVFNLGSGTGVSVLEVIRAFESVTGEKLNWSFGPRRSGDAAAVYANRDKATRELGWEPRYALTDMLESQWKWERYLAGSR
jgi:UDP-glucose 4-epimerase